ncbi:MAG: hypothetical protein L0G99_01070 [Propionibacteriales bacterium]|nr:hypothetical protein [Propionibacteriales bacterium]
MSQQEQPDRDTEKVKQRQKAKERKRAQKQRAAKNAAAAARYADVPQSWRRKLTYGAALAAAATLLGLVVLLGLFSYRIGFAPQTEVYRSGTVTVSSCAPTSGFMHECLSEVVRWNDDVQPGVELTDSPTVTVLSRTPLSGEVDVVSHVKMINTDSSTSSSGSDSEVIMPADQPVLPNGVKVLIAIGVVLGCLISVVLWGKLFWEIARAVSQRRTGR